jgi:hypothetical protein
MLSNFDQVKKQLKELSEVLNLFKSEAVQLRIVELLLNEDGEDTEETQENSSSTPRVKTKRKSKRSIQKMDAETKANKKTNNRKSSGTPGQSAILEELISKGWFDKPKTIGDIIKYCTENHAKKFKSTDLSPYLVARIRNNTLKRTKNSESKQYEYTKK